MIPLIGSSTIFTCDSATLMNNIFTNCLSYENSILVADLSDNFCVFILSASTKLDNVIIHLLIPIHYNILDQILTVLSEIISLLSIIPIIIPSIISNNSQHYDSLIATLLASYDSIPNQDYKVVIHIGHG